MEKTKKAQGRKPDENRSKRFELRLTVAEHMKLIGLGGARWVRERLRGKKS